MIVDTPAEEGVGEVFFEVAGEDDDDVLPLAVGGELYFLIELGYFELIIFDLVEEVIGEIAGGFVDLVDEDDAAAAFVGNAASVEDRGA